MRTLTRKAGAGLLALALGLLTFAHTAMADTASTSGTTSSIFTFTTGTTQRTQNHAGDDLGFTKTGGTNPAIDMRWVKCTDPSVVGTTITNITNDGNQRIWANFIQGACFKLQYRGWTQASGTFTGTVAWNANFA
ncbi:MAG: hypothetical protein RLZZ623_849 [Actinomycetota bacterium]|jgi:hypothetical protein